MDGFGSPPSARTAPAGGTRCDGILAITPPAPMPVLAAWGSSHTPPPAPLPASLRLSSTPQLAPLPALLRLSSTPLLAPLPTEERLSSTPLLAMRGSAMTLSSARGPLLTELSMERRASLETCVHEGAVPALPSPAPARPSARRERKRGRKPAASGSVPLDRCVPPYPALSAEAGGPAPGSSTAGTGPTLPPQQPLPASSPTAPLAPSLGLRIQRQLSLVAFPNPRLLPSHTARRFRRGWCPTHGARKFPAVLLPGPVNGTWPCRTSLTSLSLRKVCPSPSAPDLRPSEPRPTGTPPPPLRPGASNLTARSGEMWRTWAPLTGPLPSRHLPSEFGFSSRELVSRSLTFLSIFVRLAA